MRKQPGNIRFDVELNPTQETFIDALNDPSVHTIGFGGAKKGGKALALDTPIPTPLGWTTMGDIQTGDWVFDECGKPCIVVAATEPMFHHCVYEVVFDDGEVIVADAEHEWLTETLAARQSAKRFTQKVPAKEPQFARPQARVLPSVITTKEIASTLTTRADNCANHVVRCTQPLRCAEAILPVHPYVLGMWLGDGTTGYSSFTSADIQVVDEVERCGYKVSKIPSAKYGWNAKGLIMDLRKAGVDHDKHIPMRYLRASVEQRWALLQGLMDTDGTALPNGACEFYSTSLRLITGFRELLVSLGLKGKIGTGRATLNGKDCGAKYRVKFTTDQQVFRLDRKRDKQKKKVCGRTTHRTIVAVRPVPSVPVRCIQVSSASHLYLCGESMIPTHNSYIARLSMLMRRTMFPGTNCAITRKAYADVMGNHFAPLKELMRESGMWSGKVTDKRVRWDSKYMCFELNQFRYQGTPSKIYLGYLETEADADRYQGHEFMDLFHEESAQHLFKTLAAMNKELFTPAHVIGATPKIIYTWNPDGIGKRDMKTRVKAPALRGEPGYVFIFSNYRDNVVGIRNPDEWAHSIRRQYKDEPWKIAAHLEGDDNADPDKWYVFDEEEGGRNVRTLKIPYWAKHFAGVDYGYSSSAFAAVYFAKWQDRTAPYAKHWHCYGEVKGHRLEPDEQAVMAWRQEDLIGFPPPPYSIRYAGFESRIHVPTLRGELSNTVAQMWDATRHPDRPHDDNGWVTTAARKSGRNEGNAVMRWLLKIGVMTIDPSCQALIQEIADAQHEKTPDKRIGPGTDPKQPDDFQDAAKHPTKEVWQHEYAAAEQRRESYEEAA